MSNSKNYVKKHKGHDVPDGAEKFLAFHHFLDQPDRHEFYRWVGDSPEYFDYDDKKWAVISSKANYDKAIELPEQDLPNWDDAPEWADGVALAPWNNNLMLWFNGDKYQYIDALKTDSVYAMEDDNFIEYHMKRPIAIEDKEWLPVVGEVVRVAFDGHVSGLSEYEANLDGKKVELVYSFNRENGSAWFVVKSECSCHCFRSHCFKPLKADEELEREAFIAEGLTLQPVLTIEQAGIIEHALGLAFDAGFTAPKGEG